MRKSLKDIMNDLEKSDAKQHGSPEEDEAQRQKAIEKLKECNTWALIYIGEKENGAVSMIAKDEIDKLGTASVEFLHRLAKCASGG